MFDKKKYNKEYYAKNIVKETARRKENTLGFALSCVKVRAKRKNIAFNLTKEDMIFPEVCPILGIKLERRKGYGSNYNSPSIDRIDNTKGYTKDNIQIMSRRANAMKSDASPEELLLFANWILKTYG